MQNWNKTAENIQEQIYVLQSELEKAQNSLSRSTDSSEIDKLQSRIDTLSAQIRDLQRKKNDALKKAQEGSRAREEAAKPRIQPYSGSKVPIPDVSSGATYEEVKQAMFNNLKVELAQLTGEVNKTWGPNQTVSIDSAQQKRLKELSQKIQNFDSYFAGIWQSEFAPYTKPSISSIPQQGMGATDQMGNVTRSGLSRRDMYNIAKQHKIPIRSSQLDVSDQDFLGYLKGEYQKKTGQQLMWM